MLYNVKSILPRVHWSTEELTEGAFIVGVNTTMPTSPPSPTKMERVIAVGVNKTISTILDVLGNVTRDVVTTIITPSSQDVVPIPPTNGDGDHPAVPNSGSGPTPSEVGLILKVVFALSFALHREK